VKLVHYIVSCIVTVPEGKMYAYSEWIQD